MTPIKQQKYYWQPTAIGDISIVLQLMYTIRSWLYMRIPAQTVKYCGKHQKDSVSWQGYIKTSGYVEGYIKDR